VVDCVVADDDSEAEDDLPGTVDYGKSSSPLSNGFDITEVLVLLTMCCCCVIHFLT